MFHIYIFMKMASVLVIFLFCFVGIINGQVQFNGKCNNVTTQQSFNFTKYLGQWYEIEKYPTFFDNGASCHSVNYYEKNGTIEVQNTMLLHGKNITVYGTMEEKNAGQQDGKLKLKFPVIHSTYSEYWVLGTDYISYSVVWFCVQNNNTNDQFAWILSRTKNETESQRNEVYKILQNNKMDSDHFIKVNQTHCAAKWRKKNSASTARVSLMLVFVTFFIKNLF